MPRRVQVRGEGMCRWSENSSRYWAAVLDLSQFFRRVFMLNRMLIGAALVFAFAQVTVAQESQKSLAATLGVQVFPKAGQDAAQQSKDEGECYGWAVQNTGVDPFDLEKKEAEQAQQAAQAGQQASQAKQGAGVRGAVGGAVAGAVIGEIADDDAGKGAAYGAATGAVVARRQARKSEAQAQSQIQQQAQQQAQVTQEQRNNFRNAFSACLEAKDYIAKH